MPWVKDAMKGMIQGKLQSLHNVEGADYLQAYSETVLQYVLANTQVMYAWAGVNPSGVPDPVAVVPCTLSGGTPFSGPSQALPEFYAKLSSMIQGITIVPGGGFTIAPTVFNPGYQIVPTVGPHCDTFEKTLDAICTDICTSFPLLINPAPASGAHAAFTGSTVSMQVI